MSKNMEKFFDNIDKLAKIVSPEDFATPVTTNPQNFIGSGAMILNRLYPPAAAAAAATAALPLAATSQQQLFNEYATDVKEKKAMPLADEIVHEIRKNTLLSILDAKKNGEDHDPWDEKEEGVGWVTNDLSGYLEIWNTWNPDGMRKNIEVETFNHAATVKEITAMLSHMSEPFLLGFYKYVLSTFPLGDKDPGPYHFLLRNRPQKQKIALAKAFFK